MFTEALRALRKRRDEVVQESQHLLSEIDREITMLEGQVSSRSSPNSKNGRHKTEAGEFRVLNDLWPAIKIILHRHGASTQENSVDAKTLIAELRTGGALDRYSAERAERVPFITVSQHKDEVRYDKKAKKVWLISRE